MIAASYIGSGEYVEKIFSMSGFQPNEE